MNLKPVAYRERGGWMAVVEDERGEIVARRHPPYSTEDEAQAAAVNMALRYGSHESVMARIEATAMLQQAKQMIVDSRRLGLPSSFPMAAATLRDQLEKLVRNWDSYWEAEIKHHYQRGE